MSNSIYTTEQRKEQAHRIHNNKYDYSLWPDNIRTHDNITIICPIHGKFNQFLTSHIHSKCECPKCAIETRKQTMMDRHGVEHAAQSSRVVSKMKQTMMDRHGVDSYAKRHIPRSTLEKLNDSVWLIEQHHVQQKPLTQIAEELNISDLTVGNYLRQHNIETKYYYQSIGEKQVGEFISSFGIEIITNSHSVIPPYELDIFVPSFNVAIEYNGDFWHGNDRPWTQKRDKLKRVACKKKGIKLFVVKERDWLDDRNQIEQTLQTLLT